MEENEKSINLPKPIRWILKILLWIAFLHFAVIVYYLAIAILFTIGFMTLHWVIRGELGTGMIHFAGMLLGTYVGPVLALITLPFAIIRDKDSTRFEIIRKRVLIFLGIFVSMFGLILPIIMILKEF